MSRDPQIDVNRTIATTLARSLADQGTRVRQLESELADVALDGSRWQRAATVARRAGRSPMDALKTPVRVLRALRTSSKPAGQSLARKSRPIRLVTQPAKPHPVADDPESQAARTRRAARLAEALRSGRPLVVAASLDERTRLGLSAECELIDLQPGTWHEAVSETIDLVLLEPLRRKPGARAEAVLTDDLEEATALVGWCHDHGIPTALWNTCDPYDRPFTLHFAALVDHVFTTDLESVAYYASRLGHYRVGLAPVCTQPLLHNPISGKQRERAAVFAGGYDASHPTRGDDLATVIDGASTVIPVKIYDSNLHAAPDEQAQWPEEYSALVVGQLPVNEIGGAYRGHQIGLNASSARSSSSVLPRRVLDLIANGTPVVSTFTRGIRILLGDLVPMSDHPDGIAQLVSELLADPEALDKRRTVGLRRIMAEHTYRERLAHVAYTVAGADRPRRERRVGVVTAATTAAQATRVTELIAAQQGVDVETILVTDLAQVDVAGVTVMTPSRASEISLGEAFPDAHAIAVVNPDDWYGPHYLSGLLDGLEYGGGQATTKQAHFRAEAGQARLASSGAEYSWVTEEPVEWGRSLVSAPAAAATKLDHAATTGATIPHGLRMLSVDRFDYCAGDDGQSDMSDLSAELAIDTGWPLRSLDDEAARILQLMQVPRVLTEVDPASFPTGSFQTAGRGRLLAARTPSGHLFAFTTDSDDPWYRSLGGAIPVDQLVTNGNRTVYLRMDARTWGDRLAVNVAFSDAEGGRLPGKTYPVGQTHPIAIPDDAVGILVKFSMKGSGAALVRSIVLSRTNPAPNYIPHIAGRRTRTLLLTDYYSSYEQPYQRGFVHSRVKSYAQYGSPVDVWASSPSSTVVHSEFDGVDVMSGNLAAFRAVLESGIYHTVLVHSMYEPLWKTLKDYLDTTRVVAWMHGAELHRWWLNPEHPSMDEPRDVQIEQIKSDRRFRHWASVLAKPHPNLTFVVVSQTFLDQMQEDLAVLGVGFPPEQTVVIYNPVSPERFSYVPKPAAQRKKLLSLRPFWQTKYANDLTVAAIVDLSTEPWFGELEIMVAGDGTGFEETVAPLVDLPNVTLMKKFFTQPEIAELHKEYGVALVPTRADSQGVSRDEAMSSGLVPITTAVDAVPEFVSEAEGYVVPGEDHKAMADAVRDLYHHPEKFLAKSAAAAARIRRTVADDIVIPQEIATFAVPAETVEA